MAINPDFKNGVNASKKKYVDLTKKQDPSTVTNSLSQPSIYATDPQKMDQPQLKQALFAYSAETLNIFDQLYGDGKDGLSVGEYANAQIEINRIANSDLTEGVELSEEEAKKIAQKLDFDGDGKISVEEEAFLNEYADTYGGTNPLDGKIMHDGQEYAKSDLLNAAPLAAKFKEEYKGKTTNTDYKKAFEDAGLKYEDYLPTKATNPFDTTEPVKTTTTDTTPAATTTAPIQNGTEKKDPKNESITVDEWKAKNTDEKNDCLSRIVNNNYKGVDLYNDDGTFSDEFRQIVDAIAKENPEIYKSGRKMLGAQEVYNTIIKPGETIKLPKLEKVNGKWVKDDGKDAPAVPETKVEIVYNEDEEKIGTTETSVDEDGYTTVIHKDTTGAVTGTDMTATDALTGITMKAHLDAEGHKVYSSSQDKYGRNVSWVNYNEDGSIENSTQIIWPEGSTTETPDRTVIESKDGETYHKDTIVDGKTVKTEKCDKTGNVILEKEEAIKEINKIKFPSASAIEIGNETYNIEKDLLSEENLKAADAEVLNNLLKVLQKQTKDAAGSVTELTTEGTEALKALQENVQVNKNFENNKKAILNTLNTAIASSDVSESDKAAFQQYISFISKADLTVTDLNKYIGDLKRYGLTLDGVKTSEEIKAEAEKEEEAAAESETPDEPGYIDGVAISDITAVLKDSMHWFGDDGVKSILLSDKYDSEDIIKILNAYDEQYGEGALLKDIDFTFNTGDTESKLESKLLGAVYENISKSINETGKIDDETLLAASRLLNGAMDRAGTADDIVKGILEMYKGNTDVLDQIKKRYSERYNKKLLDVVMGDYSFSLKRYYSGILIGDDK